MQRGFEGRADAKRACVAPLGFFLPLDGAPPSPISRSACPSPFSSGMRAVPQQTSCGRRWRGRLLWGRGLRRSGQRRGPLCVGKQAGKQRRRVGRGTARLGRRPDDLEASAKAEPSGAATGVEVRLVRECGVTARPPLSFAATSLVPLPPLHPSSLPNRTLPPVPPLQGWRAWRARASIPPLRGVRIDVADLRESGPLQPVAPDGVAGERVRTAHHHKCTARSSQSHIDLRGERVREQRWWRGPQASGHQRGPIC